MHCWQSTTIGRRVDLEQEIRTIKPSLLPADNFCPKNILFHWQLEEWNVVPDTKETGAETSQFISFF